MCCLGPGLIMPNADTEPGDTESMIDTIGPILAMLGDMGPMAPFIDDEPTGAEPMAPFVADDPTGTAPFINDDTTGTAPFIDDELTGTAPFIDDDPTGDEPIAALLNGS